MNPSIFMFLSILLISTPLLKTLFDHSPNHLYIPFNIHFLKTRYIDQLYLNLMMLSPLTILGSRYFFGSLSNMFLLFVLLITKTVDKGSFAHPTLPHQHHIHLQKRFSFVSHFFILMVFLFVKGFLVDANGLRVYQFCSEIRVFFLILQIFTLSLMRLPL